MILTETSIFRQHKNSFLGSSWSVLQPFIHIMIISYVFSFLFKQPAEVLVRNLIAGIPLWTFIMNSLLSGSKSLIDRSEILKKISIRKTLLPISDILVHFYTFLWAFISMYLALIIIYPAYLSFTIIYAPIVIIPTIISIICVGAALAYITPYIMDVPHIITVLLNAVYWTLPILYPYDLIPEEKKWLFEINPLFHLIRPLQYLVLNCTFPPLIIMIKACLIMLISMIISYYVINALSRNVVYYL
ncbi:MAG: ABC transporter permease [Rickettsiaceae bacterium]|nr:ABC transporter permease [Rickettsiaceae bacterium]